MMPEVVMFRQLACILILAAALPLAAAPSFDSEMRIGVPGNGNWEVGLYDSPGGSLVSKGQYDWISGVPLAWKLDYNAATGALTYFYNLSGGTYRSSIKETVLNSDSLNALQLWVATEDKVKKGNSISVSKLVLVTNKESYTLPGLSVSGPGQLQQTYFGVPVTGDFTLTGLTTMLFDSPRPTQSSLTFHIQSGTLAVPEPATILSLCGMFALLAARGARKKAA